MRIERISFSSAGTGTKKTTSGTKKSTKSKTTKKEEK